MNHLTKITSKFNASAILIASLIIAFTGCSKKDDPINLGEVTLSNKATFGNVLVDGKGKTLYFYSLDVSGQSKCTGNCLTFWPIYHEVNIKPGTGLDAADFATITRSDGAQQTTYKGWPLYYYAGDVTIGMTSGDNAEEVWFVAKPDYSLMVASAQLVGGDANNYVINSNTYVTGTGLTQYFVDFSGRTLYLHVTDTKNTNTFTAADFSNDSSWPIFSVDVSNLPTAIKASDFANIPFHGRPQLNYKGYPLYYYGQDGTTRGNTKGITVGGIGTKWRVINEDVVALP